MNKSLMLTLLVNYLVIVLIIFFAQRKLIYLPDKHPALEHQQLVTTANLQYWPGAENYRAIVKSSTSESYRGTVLVFHGNAGSAVFRVHYINALENIGYHVILAEYPGYGARPGTQSEKLMIDDAIKTTQLVYQQFGEPLFLIGESLGTGVVSGIIANQQVPVQGLILITPFDSLANIAQSHYWWALAKWLIRDRYDNVAHLKGYTGNIAMVMAAQDNIIPNKHTQKLFASITTRKQLWTLANADHNNWYISTDQRWWSEIMKFIESYQ